MQDYTCFGALSCSIIWSKLFRKDLKARLTISLSPIRSMIKDFLVVAREVGSELGWFRLREACNVFEAVCFFFGKAETFSFFTEEREVDIEMVVKDGLETLGVENFEDFETGVAALFVVVAALIMLFSLLG